MPSDGNGFHEYSRAKRASSPFPFFSSHDSVFRVNSFLSNFIEYSTQLDEENIMIRLPSFWRKYRKMAKKSLQTIQSIYAQPSGKEPRSFLIKFKLAVHLMRRHPDFSGLLAAGEYEIPVPNGVRDKNSFHRFRGDGISQKS